MRAEDHNVERGVAVAKCHDVAALEWMQLEEQPLGGRAKSGSMSAEGFHVITDGSVLGVSGRWGACGWSVVRLDHDEEMGPMRGKYGALDGELEVQRTIERAGLTAFLCLLRKKTGTMVHVGNKGTIDGLWRGEMMCTGPEAKDADLEEVVHVTAHRLKKEHKKMTLFEHICQ